MQKKYLYRIILISLMIAGSFAVLSSTRTRVTSKPDCSQNMKDCTKQNLKDCIDKGNQETPSGELIWESLPRQFISTISLP